MEIREYINSLNIRYRSGHSTEHTYRADLQNLIESLAPGVMATNEPHRIECGAPDYIITRKNIPIGFIEAKDLGADLGSRAHKEQFDRYRQSLNNLIITDYLTFQFYVDGIHVTTVAIGQIQNNKVVALTGNFDNFSRLMTDFCNFKGQTITSSQKLARLMAGKARLLADVIEKALTTPESEDDNNLHGQFESFKQVLIHDITAKDFADMYAQTIAYGMFAARLNDPSLEDFTRTEAAELVPKSNPFLRKLFQYVAGYDLDDRIKWIIDALADVFRAANVSALLKDFGRETRQTDPIIHFYETFLSEYDPALRKSRGVWYTPEPVVYFIIRAIDYLLQTEFGLSQGITDTSKIKIKVNVQGKMAEREVHRVQFLDPATGTASFGAEIIRQSYAKFEGQQGLWNNYVEEHLIPRLYGFEILMASYAMAHLKLDLLLKETGYKPNKEQRFRIYLTNSLEEHHPDTGTLFANWLSTEANEANHVKRDVPVMVVTGNPPYSISSNNKSEWIEELVSGYKKDLNEKNIQALSDDYVKFIGLGQYYIDKNGEGLLAYITNNSFLDGVIHRQMRKSLVESFDKIYILDLHGNSKKKEVGPNGEPDQNVFDIMQGVSICILMKNETNNNSEFAEVYHTELYGKRDFKYEFLSNTMFENIRWERINLHHPEYIFVKRNEGIRSKYLRGFSLDEIWDKSNTGVETGRDIFFISESRQILKDRFKTIDNETIIQYNIKDSDNFRFLTNLNKSVYAEDNIRRYLAKPFDYKYCYYDPSILRRGSYEIQKQFLYSGNVGLVCKRGRLLGNNSNFSHITITNNVTDKNILADQSFIFPLYTYPATKSDQNNGRTPARIPNLNAEIVGQIAEKLSLTFVSEKNSPPLEGCPTGAVALSAHAPEAHPSDREAFSPSATDTGKETVTVINNIAIKRNFVENLPHNSSLSQLAKDKRKAGILSEVLFWQQVHKGHFHHIDFDRQRVIGNYIVDFYVKTLGLVVEIDGHSHDTKADYDAKRQAYLESFGLRVYRIKDGDVKMQLGKVMDELEKYIIQEYGEMTTPAFSHPSKGGAFSPVDILDYIYAVLHSPTYREKYKEFLKIDFPRVPYPKEVETFWQLVKLGGELRQLHLMESPLLNTLITRYPVGGSNTVEKVRYEGGRVYINDTQYFDQVPAGAWEFYIGGYQPAQKWLKDRKGRTLLFDDILHYQKIIVALHETGRVMQEIDGIGIE